MVRRDNEHFREISNPLFLNIQVNFSPYRKYKIIHVKFKTYISKVQNAELELLHAWEPIQGGDDSVIEIGWNTRKALFQARQWRNGENTKIRWNTKQINRSMLVWGRWLEWDGFKCKAFYNQTCINVYETLAYKRFIVSRQVWKIALKTDTLCKKMVCRIHP